MLEKCHVCHVWSAQLLWAEMRASVCAVSFTEDSGPDSYHSPLHPGGCPVLLPQRLAALMQKTPSSNICHAGAAGCLMATPTADYVVKMKSHSCLFDL